MNNPLDIIILIAIAFGLVRGFIKGFLIEIASLVSLVLGLYFGAHFSDFLGHILETQFGWGYQVCSIVSFGIIFIAVVWGVYLLAGLLTKTLKILALGFVNRIIGAVFGGLKWSLIISAILFIIVNFNLMKSSLSSSTLASPLMDMGSFIYGKVKEFRGGSSSEILSTENLWENL